MIVEHALRMKPNAYAPYDPLETLKPFANQVWIVDGPEICMSVLGLTFHFPTRMTVVRLPSGDLWLHSPIAWSERLARSIANLGPVRRLIAPNAFHYRILASGGIAFLRRAPMARQDLQRKPRPVWSSTRHSGNSAERMGGRIRPMRHAGKRPDGGRLLSPREPDPHRHRSHREFRAATRAQPTAAIADPHGRGGRPGWESADRHEAELPRPSRRGAQIGPAHARLVAVRKSSCRMGVATRPTAWPSCGERSVGSCRRVPRRRPQAGVGSLHGAMSRRLGSSAVCQAARGKPSGHSPVRGRR